MLKDGKVLLELEKYYHETPDKDHFIQLIDCLTDSLVIVPMNAQISSANAEIFKNAKVGDEIALADDLRLTPDYLKNESGNLYIPIFSQMEQAAIQDYIKGFSTVSMHISEVIELYKHPKAKLDGIVLDPFSQNIVFYEDIIKVMENVMENKENILKNNKA